MTKRKAEILSYLGNADSKKRFFPPPITRVPRTSPLPLSFAQERLWFLEQIEPGNTVYNICRAARLRGALSIKALEASLNEIIRRHEVLRTSFEVNDGQPVQVVASSVKLKLSRRDLSKIAEADRDHEIERFVAEEARRPFDLTRAPLLRANMLRLGQADHIFILATHHIVSDAWSMGILTRELWSLYEAYVSDRSSPLQDLSIQYADFAVWQREWLQGEVLRSQLSYWKKQLDDFSILNLPTDRQRPPRQSFHGARHPIALPQPLTAAINELSHDAGVTPFMTLLAAFQVLLYRYTGQEDVIVGSPVANRSRTELESVIGFFVNTLVLRADLSGNPTFKEALQRVREVCLGAYAHQDMPFEKLVEELKPERDTSRNPLFQVMFVLQNATRPFRGISGLAIEPIEMTTTRSPFDLSLFLREREKKYIGSIEYNTDLFDVFTIDRMAGHFCTLLEGTVADPDRRISVLPILSQAEQSQLLVEWNDTAADYPKDKCIHELFEEQVEKTPDAIAATFNGRQLTYRQLNTRANQLAHYLRGLGVGPEALVGICVERSMEMVVGLLGILKTGGAYVPLDPAYPKERLAFMVEDAQVSAIVTQEKCLESGRLSAVDGQPPQVCLDRDWPVIERESGENPITEVDSNNLAYVIYTSGSTGRPKGVAIEHKNTVALLSWARSVFTRGEIAGVLASTSICFDLSIFELFFPLSWGGQVVLVENALDLHETSSANQITLVNTVPSIMTALLAAGRLPKSVRVVNLAGEPLKSELVKEIYQTGIVEKVYDLYGPSETTTYSTFTLRTADGPATIGRPISNTQIYLLDSHLEPVPIGVPGELYIGGGGVARGYLNRPELTIEKFIRNPFIGAANCRLYRTGDRARYSPDGNLQFLGRFDNQIKLRGYRIELGEIESVLNQHPAVKESVVVVRARGSSEEKELFGYVLPREGAPLSSAELRIFLKDKLPGYMVPSAFVVLDALPITPNGKVDRSKLPAPKQFFYDVAVAPRTEIEELVANVWRDVLKVETIGVHDNFIDLGGHSLLAIQIISRVREVFDKDVPLLALFEAPTIAGLAGKIEETISGRSHELPPIVRVPRDRPLPLSMNQEHLWRLDRMIPGTHFFNMPYVYRLTGGLNVSALEQAFQEIIKRHEALRTVFSERDGRPVQVIREVPEFQLPYMDLRGQSADDVSQKAARFTLEEREGPFDLASGPLLRIKLLRLTETEYLLLVTLHHIISDHWSMEIFRSELTNLYEAFSQGQPSPLPDLAIQFADYAFWERRCLETGLWDVQVDYWKKQLAGRSTRIEFERDRERKEELSFRTSRQPMVFDDDLIAGIKNVARQENCTPFMVLIATLSILLYLRTGHTNLRIATLVANRAKKEIESAIGHVMNTVILRIDLVPAMTFKQLLRRVREVNLAAFVSQEVPFEYIGDVFDNAKDIDRSPLCQVLVIYNTGMPSVVKLPGLTFASLAIKSIRAETEVALSTFDLIFDLKETSTELTGSVNYKTHLIDNNVLTLMTGVFFSILKKLVRATGARITESSYNE